ncbi:MAG: LCP family protein [Bacillota bacterium]|nr:LCP family protein [Bacillota bacterium]
MKERTAKIHNKIKFIKQRKLPIIMLTIVGMLVALILAGGITICSYLEKFNKINYENLEVADKNEDFIKLQNEIHNSGLAIDENEIKENINSEPTYVPVKLVPLNKISPDIDNILLLGLDVLEEDSDNGRSDVMIIASIDHENKKFKLASILRDCYVEIPGHKKNRINAAYTFGGAALAINTVNLNFSTDIQKYIKVDFFGIAKIIDALGGVRIGDISKSEAEQIRIYAAGKSDVKAGQNVLLNGKEAVAYARIRHIDSDFKRTDRQREVFQGMIDKIFSMSLSMAISKLDVILPNLTTNLTKDELISIAWEVLTEKYDKSAGQFRIPVENSYEFATINGADVIIPDLKKNTEALMGFIYGDTGN